MKKQTDIKTLEKRRKILRGIGIRMLILLLLIAAAYGANNRIGVTEYDYETDQLAFSFDGFRIVQLSDLHNKIFPKNNETLMREVQDLHPDLIVLTGDIIDASSHTDIPAAELFMEQIVQIAPVYYVLGNHEHYLSQDQLNPFLDKIAELGVTLLMNETAEITAQNGQHFTLIGMDDYSLQANILKTLADETQEDFQVLLAHEPQYLQENYAPAGVDLVLSGHAHGGQFRIPFLHRGIWAPDQGFFPRMTEGCFTEGKTTMYVSRGLGNSAFPLRLFNHPEIVSVTLHVVK